MADCSVSPITKGGAEALIKQTRGGKPFGEGKIISEMWKSQGSFGVEKLTQLFNSIYHTGQIPDDLVKSKYSSPYTIHHKNILKGDPQYSESSDRHRSE